MRIRDVATATGLLVLVLTLGGCPGAGDPGGVMIDQMSRIADAVEDIDDEASARDAAKVIANATEEMKQVSAQIEAMPVAARAAAASQYMGKYTEHQMRISTAMANLARNPQWAAIVGEELQKMYSSTAGS